MKKGPALCLDLFLVAMLSFLAHVVIVALWSVFQPYPYDSTVCVFYVTFLLGVIIWIKKFKPFL